MASTKYRLVCTKCGKVYGSMAEWFAAGHKCSCGSARAEAEYFAPYSELFKSTENEKSIFRYFDFLPLEERKNIVSCNEGAALIEEWEFLNAFAREKYGIDCHALVCRNDLNGGTGTFKDPAAALAASVFKENGVKEFALPSTGNAGTSFSKYCSLAGVKFSVFLPSDVSEDTVKEISSHGQNLVISKGNYAQAKQEASEYQKKYGTMLSSGNIDPLRVEAKRTMAFEFIRQLGSMPDVYIQAVAGGTGPISLDKGIRELRKAGIETKYPRMVLAQQDKCDPMVQGWENANAKGFPEGWEKDYPVIETDTKISILSTANPGMYPIVAPLVRNSNGTFLRVKEADLAGIAKWIYDNNSVLLGPASIVCIAGFMEACRVGAIHNGDKVLLNIGENCNRNCWFKNLVMQS